ncbi:hypothetical protein [Heyndrickxia oleronia]|uniref:hypothetical protein n=1 Tax=Heyndrickxia oleronia TaxID=38875 RepID=UPI001B035DFD|nr:hypothetical protein [Heyndrickxia oleronia]GIN38448.1 hypothetical protein J19TS1_13970 [Heyndrickxia oleronia]
MNEITLKASYIQWKNPIIGQPTRPVKDHYYARRIVAIVNGEERQFRFLSAEIPLEATEEDMLATIEELLQSEQVEKEKEEQPTNAE